MIVCENNPKSHLFQTQFIRMFLLLVVTVVIQLHKRLMCNHHSPLIPLILLRGRVIPLKQLLVDIHLNHHSQGIPHNHRLVGRGTHLNPHSQEDIRNGATQALFRTVSPDTRLVHHRTHQEDHQTLLPEGMDNQLQPQALIRHQVSFF